MDVEKDGAAATAGDVIGHLTEILALVLITQFGQLQSFLMAHGDGARARGGVQHPSVGGERVGFSMTSELHRLCIVKLVNLSTWGRH